ncbi:DUF349 domain-containing protein [Alteromonas sp. 5E99-2]|uniref:DUF349 domain-containing protein n=1 Tax=Alteromonas sp. 5E99-2 TaxID=2817683 RepID=UPI001A9A03CF|nr:DUF349 domain-containing protein [Alteromonas sp. 5E99-2]MBO1255395.1 DUF349 domain-containing protein [Alteromonas sp. 5E99-2]
MIFSKFFTPDYAKPDPKLRCAAIDKLSPSLPKERQILHELAFNDDSVDVTLAALTKLDSFALWQKMAQIAKNARVKKAAVVKVKQTIFSSQSMSDSEKKQFLIESADTELCSEVLERGGVFFDDTDFAIKLIDKVNKPSLAEAVFLKHGQMDLKAHLVESQNDVGVLQRWLKKNQIADNSELIVKKISRLEALKSRPEELIRQVKMNLAKYLALTEQSDFEIVVKEKELLESEYQQFATEFDVLKERDKIQFEEKKLTIDKKVAFHIESMESSYKEEQLLQEKQLQLEAITSLVQILANDVNTIFNDLEAVTLSQLEELQVRIQNANDDLAKFADLIGRENSEPLAQRLDELKTKLIRLPEWQRHGELVSKAIQFVEEEKEKILTTPEAIQEKLPLLESHFHDVYDKSSPLAIVHFEQWSSIKKQLRKRLRDHKETVKQAVTQLNRSFGKVSSLIEQGKYKAAFSQFKLLDKQWEKATDAVKENLARKYDDVSQKITHLEEWQQYLASPRKPELVTQAQSLINDSELSMKQRADQIKVLRKQWQSLSLGSQLSQSDIEQNKAFDDALEQAFVPCRAFFAEQEEIRQAAKTERESLLFELDQMLKDTVSIDEDYAKRFENIQRQWRDTPSLPPKDYAYFKQEFDKRRDAIFAKLTPYFEENKRVKSALIKQVEALLSKEHSSEAVEEAKTLQKQWRNIGTSGKRFDNKLWRSFREANDKVFARAKDERDVKQQALSAEINAITQLINDFLVQSVDLKKGAYDTLFSELSDKVKTLPKGVGGSLIEKLNQVEEKRKLHSQRSAIVKRQAHAQNLSDFLRFRCDNSNVEITAFTSWNELPKVWQQAAKNEINGVANLSEQLVTLEILLKLETPKEHQDIKQALQMKLLSDNFNNSQRVSVSELLNVFVGTFVDSPDETVLERIDCVVNAAYVEPTNSEV